jgi:glycerophosphoryl diester phosphodiesterase
VKIVAHRGASAEAPENTMAAFELAIRRGANVIETDLRLTKDGIVACLHDATLARTFGDARALAAVVASEAKALGVPLLTDTP